MTRRKDKPKNLVEKISRYIKENPKKLAITAGCVAAAAISSFICYNVGKQETAEKKEVFPRDVGKDITLFWINKWTQPPEISDVYDIRRRNIYITCPTESSWVVLKRVEKDLLERGNKVILFNGKTDLEKDSSSIILARKYGLRDEFIKGLRRLWEHPEVNDTLIAHGLPTCLKYLTVVENYARKEGESSAGAVGPWQLMKRTAKKNGIIVNGKIDERTDWNKSSSAAANYLERLGKIPELEHFDLRITAYNKGEGNVLKLLKMVNGSSLKDIHHLLNHESGEFYPRLLAAWELGENTNRYCLDIKVEQLKKLHFKIAPKIGYDITKTFDPIDFFPYETLTCIQPGQIYLIKDGSIWITIAHQREFDSAETNKIKLPIVIDIGDAAKNEYKK